MNSHRALNAVLMCLTLCPQAAAQALAQFEVVSIKRHVTLEASGGIQNLPDGTMIMINQAIASLIRGAAPTPVREVVGAPDWVNTERYDVTTKPPAGATPEQRREMTRRMFIDRMKFVGHVEERERETFALVLARSDGRLGPKLQRSTLDCSPRPVDPKAPLPAPEQDVRKSCGLMVSTTSIVSGGITIDRLLLSLGGMAGGLVNNRTGLQGVYAVELTFSPGGLTPDEKRGDEPPQFLTALQEQLGLKLQPEKTMVPVLVIDSIERPSEN
jgi:bla regulator protein blaR1